MRFKASPFKGKKRNDISQSSILSVLTRGNYQLSIINYQLMNPIVRIFGYPLKTAILSGLGLAQIGEFSFVLASKGEILGLVSRRVYLYHFHKILQSVKEQAMGR